MKKNKGKKIRMRTEVDFHSETYEGQEDKGREGVEDLARDEEEKEKDGKIEKLKEERKRDEYME